MTRAHESPGTRKSKRIAAYADGALDERQRERVAHEIESDPGLQAEHVRLAALGKLAREAWSEGPQAPAPEYLIAALRPHMNRIDREIEARSWSQRLGRLWSSLWRPAPVGVLAGAATLMMLAILQPPTTSGPDLSASIAARGAEPRVVQVPPRLPAGRSAFQHANSLASRDFSGIGAPAFPTASPWRAPNYEAASEIYDIASEAPFMIFQGEDGDTIIWQLEERPQDLSSLRGERWAGAA